MKGLVYGSTEHAVLRFIARCTGFDVAHFKKLLIDKVNENGGAFSKTGKFPIGEDFIAVVEKGIVITVIDTSQKKKKKEK